LLGLVGGVEQAAAEAVGDDRVGVAVALEEGAVARNRKVRACPLFRSPRRSTCPKLSEGQEP
jgi:hypothetical protein